MMKMELVTCESDYCDTMICGKSMIVSLWSDKRNTSDTTICRSGQLYSEFKE